MISWLRSVVNFFGGGLSVIWHAVLNVVETVYNDLTDRDAFILRYAAQVWAVTIQLSIEFSDFVSGDYNVFVRWTFNTFAAFLRIIDANYNRLANAINALSHRSQQSITVVQDNLNNSIANLIRWVISHIFNPLFSDVSRALAWIAHEGAYVFSLLSNLEKLADLIMAFLWSGWLVLFRKYAKAIVTYVLRNWRIIMPDIAAVLEDILTSLF